MTFMEKFIQEKQIIDAQTTSGALISFSLESAEAVKTVWRNRQKLTEATVTELIWEYQKSKMYGLEVQDLDGNSLEPVWMKM